MRKSKVLIGVLVVAVILLGIRVIGCEKNTEKMIAGSYEQISDSFERASEKMKAGGNPETVIEELGYDTWKNADQLEDLTHSAFFADNLYSPELVSLMLTCIASQDIDPKEIKNYEELILSISDQLKWFGWKQIRMDGGFLHYKKDMEMIVQNIDIMIKEANLD